MSTGEVAPVLKMVFVESTKNKCLPFKEEQTTFIPN